MAKHSQAAKRTRRTALVICIFAAVGAMLLAVRVQETSYDAGSGLLRESSYYALALPGIEPFFHKVGIFTVRDELVETGVSRHLATSRGAGFREPRWVLMWSSIHGVMEKVTADGARPYILSDSYFNLVETMVRPLVTEEEYERFIRLSLDPKILLSNRLIQSSALESLESTDDLNVRRTLLRRQLESLGYGAEVFDLGQADAFD